MITRRLILDYLASHKEEFREKYSVEKIGLFGSFARNEATQNSDIDIFVKMQPKMFDMIALKQQIEEELHAKVDLIREHKHMKPLLREMIYKDLAYV